jgi:hypothetical protein
MRGDEERVRTVRAMWLCAGGSLARPGIGCRYVRVRERLIIWDIQKVNASMMHSMTDLAQHRDIWHAHNAKNWGTECIIMRCDMILMHHPDLVHHRDMWYDLEALKKRISCMSWYGDLKLNARNLVGVYELKSEIWAEDYGPKTPSFDRKIVS